MLVVGQLETASAAADPDAIVAGLDVAFIGPVDLRVALGHPGDADHLDVARAVREGYRYVLVFSDLALLASGARTGLCRP